MKQCHYSAVLFWLLFTVRVSVAQPNASDVRAGFPVFDIGGLSIDQKANGCLIRIYCARKLPDIESWRLGRGGDTWLYVTFADAKADITILERVKPAGIVKKILVFQSENSVQLTFWLKGEIHSSELILPEQSDDILIAIPTPQDERSLVHEDN